MKLNQIVITQIAAQFMVNSKPKQKNGNQNKLFIMIIIVKISDHREIIILF